MHASGKNASRAGGRRLKAEVRNVLTSMDMDRALDALYKMPFRRVINPLFSFLCAGDDLLRWKSVTALGRITARLADTDMEAARVVMR
ncbi:MAG: hypothetical protein J7M32_10935, partial [Deltaproteobacteria bacterium]|nr:hypothetical protein [Deltaproteobacteria bacterium]